MSPAPTEGPNGAPKAPSPDVPPIKPPVTPPAGSPVVPPVPMTAPAVWILGEKFDSTADIAVPDKLLDQVIGQDHAVTVVRKAAEQKRHVMLIGDPGTGKSMLARAMTEFLPKEELEDVIAYPNQEDPNTPRIRVVPAGKGKEIVDAQKFEARKKQEQRNVVMNMLALVFVAVGVSLMIYYKNPLYFLLAAGMALFIFMFSRNPAMGRSVQMVPKLLVGHDTDEVAPFIDATAAHSGALLGDVRHDPFQAGGLETPAHERVEAGSIHKANRGVLYIDEINTLSLQSQQHLLTAIQERKFQITGQSERSSGAMVKTEPVPCNFILVAAGNLDALQGMHPALRSRVRGYGYEVYVRDRMDDTEENRRKLIRFVAQEVHRDGKIPHFTKPAVAEIIHEAQRRAGEKDKLTLRLRELGGLVRVAGDLAKGEGATHATPQHVVQAKSAARSLEQQYYDRQLEHKQRYNLVRTDGARIGVVHGLSVIPAGTGMSEFSGEVMDIEAEVTPASKHGEGRVIAPEKLGDIAKASVSHISAIVKKFLGKDVSDFDIHVQFVLAHGGVEGDSASVTLATGILSALAGVPIKQDVAMTGSLTIHGLVMPIGGVTAKIEAAAKVGIKKVLIPQQNLAEVMIEEEYREKVQIVPCETLYDVLENALEDGPAKKAMMEKLRGLEPQRPSGGPGRAAPAPLVAKKPPVAA
jgi:Lon-like ATP-dependent protease